MDQYIVIFRGQRCTCARGDEYGSRFEPEHHELHCRWRQMAEAERELDFDEARFGKTREGERMNTEKWFPRIATSEEVKAMEAAAGLETHALATQTTYTPMTWAAFALAEMCRALEDGATPDAVFVQHFKANELALAESVDRRIAMRIHIKADLEAARAERAGWDQRVQQLKALDDRCDEATIEVIKANPDLPYQGKLGRFALQKNPPSLKLAFGEKDVTPDMLTFFAIPEEYVKVTYEIKTTAVKDALKNGLELPWAELKSDAVHLRVRKS